MSKQSQDENVICKFLANKAAEKKPTFWDYEKLVVKAPPNNQTDPLINKEPTTSLFDSLLKKEPGLFLESKDIIIPIMEVVLYCLEKNQNSDAQKQQELPYNKDSIGMLSKYMTSDLYNLNLIIEFLINKDLDFAAGS